MNQNRSSNASAESPARHFIFGRSRIAALLLAVASALFVLEASTYPYMDWIGPGSGFFPMWVGSLCLVSAVGLFISGRTPPGATPAPTDEGVEPVDPRRARVLVAATIALMLAAAFLLEPLGFVLTGAAAVAALLWLYGSRPVVALVVGAVGATAIFHLFAMLQVRLPTGPLGF